jgi:hypothetical protein
MAGMRPFVLSAETASVEYRSLAATGCPSSQIATDKPTAVPLWKVIVGPAPTNYDRTRKGPVFLSRIGAPDRRARVGVCPRGIADVGTITHPQRRLHDSQSRLTLPDVFSPAGARPAA